MKLVMLTGISGVGKSTIARHIEDRINPIARLGFGNIIYEVLQREGTDAGRTEIRTTPNRFISISAIKTATTILQERVVNLRQSTNVLLETHAVVSDYFGFWIFPEISDFEAVKLDAVIVIHSPFEIVEQRMIQKPEGRNLISKQSFESYQSLQDAVAVNFCLMAKCPMYVVETDNDLLKTSAILINIFENIGMSFSMT
jgi:adenylate kinase